MKIAAVAAASKIPGDIQLASQRSRFRENTHPQTPPERNKSGKSSPSHRQLQEATGSRRGMLLLQPFYIFFSNSSFEPARGVATHRLISEGGRLGGRHVVVGRLERKLLHFLVLVQVNHLHRKTTQSSASWNELISRQEKKNKTKQKRTIQTGTQPSSSPRLPYSPRRGHRDNSARREKTRRRCVTSPLLLHSLLKCIYLLIFSA